MVTPTARRAALVGLFTFGGCAWLHGKDRGPSREGDGPGAKGSPYDWGVAYYMSYDNNLTRYGESIVECIARGVASAPGHTVAAVQADFAGPGGSTRYIASGAPFRQVHLDTEDSALEHTALEYLRWFVQTYDCRRYAVIFLDHGGKLDEMCSDEHFSPAGKPWMSGAALGGLLRDELKALIGDRWELLFLQQCGRGSVENLFSFRDTAKHIMSSPVVVGAPNTYYAGVHRWLGSRPDCGGDELASKIMDEDKHYSTYTCSGAAQISLLPAMLDKAMEPFWGADRLVRPGRVQAIYNPGETFVDLGAYFLALARDNGLDEGPARELITWVKSTLFTRVACRQGDLCGLSLHVPGSTAECSLYRHFELYRRCKLAELWSRLLPTG